MWNSFVCVNVTVSMQEDLSGDSSYKTLLIRKDIHMLRHRVSALCVSFIFN